MMYFKGKKMAVRDLVQSFLDEKSWTSYRGSKEAGINKNAVKRWVAGDHGPSLDSFEAFLDACGYELEVKKKPTGVSLAARTARESGMSYGSYMNAEGVSR